MNRTLAITSMLIMIVLCAVGITRCSQGIAPDYSTGTRTGNLIQFSNKGIIWRRDKGEMLLNEFGISGSDGSTSRQLFAFNTYDDDVIKLMHEYIGQDIIVEYREWWSKPIWNDSDYEVFSVRLAE